MAQIRTKIKIGQVKPNPLAPKWLGITGIEIIAQMSGATQKTSKWVGLTTLEAILLLKINETQTL
jgi:hypothetical protein